MKTCNKYGECKPLDAFSKRKDTRDGLNYKCKACDSAYQEAQQVHARLSPVVSVS